MRRNKVVVTILLAQDVIWMSIQRLFNVMDVRGPLKQRRVLNWKPTSLLIDCFQTTTYHGM